MATGARYADSPDYFHRRYSPIPKKPLSGFRIPEDIQLKALQLLEHFPTAQDVLTIARRENYLQETVGISQTLFALGAGKDGEVLQALILADEEQL
ncbi:hypothetical protein [Pseudomonas putida]